MRWIALAVGIIGIVMLFTSQVFNLMQSSRRWRLGLPGALLVSGALPGATAEQRGWIALGIGTGLLVLNHKWLQEIQGDMVAREQEGLPPLLPRRRRWLLQADPTYMFRYRRRMFLDDWSRRRLEVMSISVNRKSNSGGAAAS